MTRSIEEFIEVRRNPFTGKASKPHLDLASIAPERGDPGSLVLRTSRCKGDEGAAPISRFGGRPFLPHGERWPRAKRPLTFVGQLRFEELYDVHRGRVPLPRKGLLAFFFDIEEPPLGHEAKDARRWRFFFVKDAADARPVDDPSDDPLPVRRIACRYEALGPKKTNEHKVCGRPDWIQSDERIDVQLLAHGLERDPKVLRAAEKAGTPVVKIIRGAERWSLLWQIDSDDDLGLSWYDDGRLYVLIDDADLRAGRFERARCIVQTH